MPSRTLDIILNGKNNIGPAVDNATKDLKRISESAEMASKALSFGLLVGGVKGVFSSLTSAVLAFRGDTDKAVEALYRLPFGVGEAIHSIKDFSDALSGAADAEKRVAENAEALKALKGIGEATEKFWQGVNTGRGPEPIRRLLEIESKTRTDLTDSFTRYQTTVEAIRKLDVADLEKAKRIHAAWDEMFAEKIAIRERDANSRLSVARAQDALLARQSEDAQRVAIEREKMVQDALDEMAARREEAELERLKQKFDDEAEYYKNAFADWVDDIRDKRQLSGLRTGTVSADNASTKLQGLAANAEERRAREQYQLLAEQKKQNAKLDALIKINERTGGQLERVFGQIMNL